MAVETIYLRKNVEKRKLSHEEFPNKSRRILRSATSSCISPPFHGFERSKGMNDVDELGLRWASLDVIRRLDVFNEDVLKYLGALPQDLYDHQDICSHVASFVEDEVAMDPDRFHTVGAKQLENDLEYLMYNEKTAKMAVQSIPGNILLSQDVDYWGVRYLEDFIMCDSGGEYKYNESCQGVWFDQPVTTFRQRGSTQGEEVNIPMYNDSANLLNQDAFDTESGAYKYYFHGTSWSSAEDIIVNGIRLDKGKCNQDFSSNFGFYASDNFDIGKEWTEGKKQSAIVVFRTPSSLLDDERKHLHLTKEDRMLNRLYTFSMNDGTEERDVYTKIKKYNSITGPMLRNRKCFLKQKVPTYRHNVLQMCIRREEFADEFTSHIFGVIYYKSKKARK